MNEDHIHTPHQHYIKQAFMRQKDQRWTGKDKKKVS